MRGRHQEPRRIIVLATLAALLIASAVADAAKHDSRGSERRTTTGAAEATRPGTLSSAWYCAEGTSVRDGRADEWIVIANASIKSIEALITALPGLGQAPVLKRVSVQARGHIRVPVSEMVRTGDPGVIVEIFGGDASVEHEIFGPGDFAVGPCASTVSNQWYFPAGTTAKDTRQYLAIFNPFGEDAVVDLTFATDEGLKRPEALTGLVIPARSRTTVRVHAHIRRQDHVATFVAARTGRVVAEQSNLFEGGGRRGVSMTLGAIAPAETWTFAESLVAPGVSQEISILNPSGSEAEVNFETHLDGDEVIEPETLTIGPRSAVTVNLGDKVRQGLGHFVVVRSTNKEVVAAQTVYSGPPAPHSGVAMYLGASRPARRWLFASGRSEAGRDEWIVGANPGTRMSKVTITVLAAGQLLVPSGFEALAIGADGRGNFRLGDALQRAEIPLVVCSDRPIFVTRGLYGGGISLGYGVPMADGPDGACLAQ